MSTKSEIHQLKAEASFVADDPWHDDRRDTFALDYYVYTPPALSCCRLPRPGAPTGTGSGLR
jgi:hypothetical protein